MLSSKRTKQFCGHTFLELLRDTEYTQDWSKEKLIGALGRSRDKSRMEYLEDENATIQIIRALHGHSHRGRNQSKLVLFETDTGGLEGT